MRFCRISSGKCGEISHFFTNVEVDFVIQRHRCKAFPWLCFTPPSTSKWRSSMYGPALQQPLVLQVTLLSDAPLCPATPPKSKRNGHKIRLSAPRPLQFRRRVVPGKRGAPHRLRGISINTMGGIAARRPEGSSAKHVPIVAVHGGLCQMVKSSQVSTLHKNTK